MAKDALQTYQKKRDFSSTQEPAGKTSARTGKKSQSAQFVVQRHDASSLHYDFRLEVGGVLKSWAVPKGPSLDPENKRLAVEVEDHPLDYASFEGTIPEGNYGAGEVRIWDAGTWESRDDPRAALKEGRLHFALKGKRLQGDWLLIRTRRQGKQQQWLLRKLDDEHVKAGHDANDEALGPVHEAAETETAAKTTNVTTSARKTRDKDQTVEEDNVVAGVTITHPERKIYSSPALSKLEFARYYEAAGDLILPHVLGRRLALLRCPEGAEHECFFQKHMQENLPDGVGVDGGMVIVENLAGVIALVQRGVIEFHTWGAKTSKPESPDRITFDLDPGDGVTWRTLAKAAGLTRSLLEELGLKPLLKTTGGKGLHLVAPLKGKTDWDSVREFARAVARQLEASQPDLFISKEVKDERKGLVFVDYLRNGDGATAVAAFSARARDGAPVSMPVAWEVLDGRRDLRGKAFNVRNALKVASEADPWADYEKSRVSLTKAMRKQVGVD